MTGHHESEQMTTADHAGGGGAASHDSHDKHLGHSPEMFQDRLLVSLLFTGPILYFSDQIQVWLSYNAVSFAGSTWVTPVLATALYIYAGWVFLQGGGRELRARQPGHDDADIDRDQRGLFLQPRCFLGA